MAFTLVFGLIAVVAVVVVTIMMGRLKKLKSEQVLLLQENTALHERLKPIIDVNAEKKRVEEEIAHQKLEIQHEVQKAAEQQRDAETELETLKAGIDRYREEFKALDEEATLHAVGMYTTRYDFATSEMYQDRLNDIRERQKTMIKEETAAVCHTTWRVGESESKGRKMVKQTLGLALRAFNGECEAATAKVKFNNITAMEARIRKGAEAINKLIQEQGSEITDEYVNLKLEELFLAHEYQEKLQEEKEEQRMIREQMREEEKALREIEKARQDAEKEEKRFEDALAKARQEAEKAVGDKHDALMSQIAELQQKVADAQQTKERALSQAQLTRSGHVYIISNIGSFGEDVFKIGMTRRLDPLDRVHELGDASVPFDFDVHAMIYAEDAPALEAALHKSFNQRRVNRVNERKEFFRVEIDEIVEAVRQFHGSEITVTRVAEAKDYRQTLSVIEEEKAVIA